MKRNILAMVLGLTAVTAPAMAATFNLGDLNANYANGYVNSESFRQVGGGSISSTYTFTLSQASIVHLSLTDQARLTGLSASLYNGNTLQTVVGPLNYNGTTVADWQSTTPMAAGSYTIDVIGAYAANRAGYALSLSSQVPAPVPGPAGLIVAGAGALVVAARKRRKARLAIA